MTASIFLYFLDRNNINEILSNNYEYIIDACDSIDTKLELIKSISEFLTRKQFRL